MPFRLTTMACMVRRPLWAWGVGGAEEGEEGWVWVGV